MGLFERFRRQVEDVATGGSPFAGFSPAQAGPAGPTGGGFAIIDLETTGLSSARDRIVEIAVIHADTAGRIVDEWTTLVNPSGPVGPTRIHGITAAEVRRAPRFADVLGEVNSRLAGRALVAHNAAFDLSFLRAEYARVGWDLPTAPSLCTLDASWTYLPHLSRRRLPDCCWASGIRLEDAHTALGDARATAKLLASYLDPHVGRPPAAKHRTLPARAATVAWPAVPRGQVPVALRGPAGPLAVPAAPGLLATLLTDLPVSSAVEDGAPETTKAYLELLAEVLEDGVLTADEAASLADLAKLYALTHEQVHAAHRGFLLSLAHKAVEDGRITRDERSELLAAAEALGFPDGIVKAVLNEARDALVTRKATGCRPLPRDWSYGRPLRIGEGVAFTGCDDLERARLEGRARAAGLRVTGAVSRRTAVLVTDDASSGTAKARAAHEFGTRIVTPAVFAELVTYLQPATPATPATARVDG